MDHALRGSVVRPRMAWAERAHDEACRIGVVGAGPQGLLHAAMLAHLGHEVQVIDEDPARVSALVQGRLSLHEPGLAEFLKLGVRQRRLVFTNQLAEAVGGRDFVFLAPELALFPDGRVDLRPLETAVRAIAPHLTDHTLVVLRCTVPVGTSATVLEWLAEGMMEDATVGVAVQPDFGCRGDGIQAALHPDRVVIGADQDSDAIPLFELYAPLECPLVLTSQASAELSKFAVSAMLATRLSTLNALAGMCELTGADVLELGEALGLDRRIGQEFLGAGLGYGGSGLFRDTRALLAQCEARGHRADLLREALAVDHAQPQRLLARIRRRFQDVGGLVFGVLGLAPKPMLDDLAEARTLPLIRTLLAEGATVQAFDPIANESARRELSTMANASLSFEPDAYAAARGADVLLVLTAWPEFAVLDFARLRAGMRGGVLLDARNCLPVAALRRAGFEVHGMGRLTGRMPTPSFGRRAMRTHAFHVAVR